MSAQSKQDKIALDRAWRAQPQVVAFAAAVEAHVAEQGLSGLDGINAALRFANAWIADNGELPVSGILCD